MEKIRVTQHCGVGAGNAYHNDRSNILKAKDLDKTMEDSHIDLDRSTNNIYVVFDSEKGCFDGKPHKPLHEYEREFYEKNYAAALEETNKKYIANRHPERCKTIDDLLRDRLPNGRANRTAPEEIILQIGDKDHHPDKELFVQCMRDYFVTLVNYSQKYGNHVHVLDMAIHVDEATPHAHLRRVIDYKDEQGITHIGQAKGLEQMGIPLPDPTAPRSRHNNYKMTFDRQMRECLQTICKNHGLDIELEAKEPGRKHIKEKEKYIALMLERQEEELKERDQQIKEEYIKAFQNINVNEDLQAVLVGASRGMGREDDYLYQVTAEELEKMNGYMRFCYTKSVSQELTDRIAHHVQKDLDRQQVREITRDLER